MRASHHVLAATALIALAACAGSAPAGDTWSVRDSAGIQIVENRASTDAVTLGHLLDTTRAQSFPDLELAYVRGMRLLADGRIVIANAGSSQLIFLDPRSGDTTAIGRQGDGPGEFAGFFGLYRCAGDSLAVLGFPSRLTVFDAQGRLGRAGPALNFRPHEMAGVASDCATTAFVRAELTPEYRQSDPAPLGMYWAPSLDADPIEVAKMWGTETTPVRGLPGPVRRPYGSDAIWTLSGNRVVVGRTDTAEARLYGRNGGLERIIRWETAARPVMASDRERYTKALSALEAESPGSGLEFIRLDRITLPDRRPLFSRLLTDDLGNLWVQRYPELPHIFDNRGFSVFGPEGRFWWIFSPTGRLLGTGTTPEEFLIHDIRDGMVAGVVRDADGVEVAQMVPLSATVLRALSTTP